LHLVLLGWLLLACLPIVWAAVISLRQYVDAFSVPVKWLAPVTFENYSRLWIDKGFYRNFLNTVIVTVGTVSVSLTVGCLAGYALSRYRGAVGFWLLLTALVFRSLPHSTLLPSFYVMFDALGIRNECWLRSISLSRSGCCARFLSTFRRSSMRPPWLTAVAASRLFGGSSSL
jgi:multiple sugar transport system permease protein